MMAVLLVTTDCQVLCVPQQAAKLDGVGRGVSSDDILLQFKLLFGYIDCPTSNQLIDHAMSVNDHDVPIKVHISYFAHIYLNFSIL